MSQENSQLPIITFNSLYNLLKEEERIAELNTLPEFFYEAAIEFIKTKEAEAKTDKDNLRIQNKLKTAKKIYLKLKKLRAKKICGLVIDNFDKTHERKEELLESELEFKESIKKTFIKTYSK